MIIREAKREDADKIYELELATFPMPWSLNSIITDLEKESKSLYFVIEVGDKIVGYAGAWLVLDEGQITNVAVRKEYRGFGFGTKLVKALVDGLHERGMKEVFLEVRVSNIAAQTVYRKLGFTVKGVRKRYYMDPTEDAYIMSCELEE